MKKFFCMFMWGGVIVYNIIAASVLYKCGYLLSANFLSVVNGVCLLKILESADVLTYAKRNANLAKCMCKIKEICNLSSKSIEIILIGWIVIVVVIISFLPLQSFWQWLLIGCVSFFSFGFNIMYKYF